MTEVVILSDSSDDEDCVLIQSVICGNKGESSEKYPELYHEALKENKLLAEFIKKCLDLENTRDMIIILKDLLKHYNEVEDSTNKSTRFQKNLVRANNLLINEPRRKFSHIKDLCDIFIRHKVKKKVPFITLSTNLKDRNGKGNCIKRSINGQTKVICSKKRKSNYFSEFNGTLSNSLDITTDTVDESLTLNSSQESNASGNRLLIPKDVQIVPENSTLNRIKLLEHKIARYKKQIAYLDELEVDDDSVNSPYIRSERLKSSIVVLYKELCELIGSKPVKRREIRLKVSDGHPPGPTRMLEDFLNQNIGSDGHLPFPDFCDVVTCVTNANIKDDLGWTKAQIMKEASLLFSTCGRTLQRRRQRAEYRDLLSRAEAGAGAGAGAGAEADPADSDPGLLARLEENRLVAVKKESEILERYTMLQYLPAKQKNGVRVEDAAVKDNPSIHPSISLFGSTAGRRPPSIVATPPDPAPSESNGFPLSSSGRQSTSSGGGRYFVFRDAVSTRDWNTSPPDLEDRSFNDNQTSMDIDREIGVINPNNTQNKDESSDSTPACKDFLKVNNNNNVCNSKESIGIGSSIITGKEVNEKSCVQNSISKETNKTGFSETAASDVKLCEEVKLEPPEDIIKRLENMGDNYTLTIEDIDMSYNWVHPSLTIEISSDSSDEE